MAYPGLTRGYIKAEGTRVSVTRQNEFNHNELTNIATKADTWGKVITQGYGRHRVAGALVWASNFYATTSGFDETTTTQDIYTSYSVSEGSDAVAKGASIFDTVVNPPQDVSRPPVSQVTHHSSKSSAIDLCYSFGKEGDTRKKRYIDKIRINDTLAYDVETGFVAKNLAFSVRYGYEDDIPELMSKYDDGKFHYKGQTLVIFNQFPTANYGDAIPSTVDVEFGCCQAGSIPEPDGCGFGGIPSAGGEILGSDGSGFPGFQGYQPGDVLIHSIARVGDHDNDACSQFVGDSEWQDGGTASLVGRDVLGGFVGHVECRFVVLTPELVDKYRNNEIRLVQGGGTFEENQFWSSQCSVLRTWMPWLSNSAGAFRALTVGDMGWGGVRNNQNEGGGFIYEQIPVPGSTICAAHLYAFGYRDGDGNYDDAKTDTTAYPGGADPNFGGTGYIFSTFRNKPTFARDQAPDNVNLPPFSVNSVRWFCGVFAAVPFVECPEIG